MSTESRAPSFVNDGSADRYPEGMETVAGVPRLPPTLHTQGAFAEDRRWLLSRNAQWFSGVARAAPGERAS